MVDHDGGREVTEALLLQLACTRALCSHSLIIIIITQQTVTNRRPPRILGSARVREVSVCRVVRAKGGVGTFEDDKTLHGSRIDEGDGLSNVLMIICYCYDSLGEYLLFFFPSGA